MDMHSSTTAAEGAGDLQAALQDKEQECENLRAQLDAARKENAQMQADFQGREISLLERVEKLKAELDRVSADPNARPPTVRFSECSAPPSDCSDMTEDDIHHSAPLDSCVDGATAGSHATGILVPHINMARSKSTPDLDHGHGASPLAHTRQSSYSTSLDMLTTPSLATSPRTTEDDFTEEEKHRVKDDSSRRVREVHRRFGDRNMAGFLRDFGFQVEGGWNPSQQTFDKQKKLGLVMSHPDKQRNKPFRERCLAEAVFKELNEWEYKPAIDRPHFGFGSIAPTGQSSSPTPTSGLPKHNRTPSYGSMHGGLGYGQSSLGYQNSRSSLEIASRLSRRSSDPRVSYSRMNTQH